MEGDKNYYKILGVDEKASNYELRKAFCKLTKELHPDTTSLNLEDAKLRLQIVLEAYENLHNPKLRNLYDKKLNIKVDKKEEENKDILYDFSTYAQPINASENRRPFSNGEIFSLLLLFLVIFVCLLFALIWANFAGRDFNSIPSWLVN